MTADPAGVDRLGQCSRSADLNDSVNPLPGDSCCGSTPFRFALVVDQVVRAEILQTRQFFIGRRGGDDRRAGGLGESDLQGKVAAWAKLHPVGRWVKASADMTTYSAARPSAPSDVLVAERFFGRHGLLEVVAGNSVDRKSILLAGHDDGLQIAAALDDTQPHPVGCSGARIDVECDDRGLDGAPHVTCGIVIGHALHRRVMSVGGADHPALEFFGRDVYAHSPAPHVSLRLSP